MNKFALSPLASTLVLIALSIILATAVMTFGESYIEDRAKFAVGTPEVGVGCDVVKFEVTKIGGVSHACYREKTVDVSLDNGPSIDINDFHVKVHGSTGVINIQNFPSRYVPLKKSDGTRLPVPYSDIGTPLKLVITPKILVSKNVVFCGEKAVTIDNIPKC